MLFERKLFFDEIRPLFGGSLTQDQVDGMEYILAVWEVEYPEEDLRWLAYALATTLFETGATMQPIAEYGKGQGHSYGLPDSETGQTYYGRKPWLRSNHLARELCPRRPGNGLVG